MKIIFLLLNLAIYTSVFSQQHFNNFYLTVSPNITLTQTAHTAITPVPVRLAPTIGGFVGIGYQQTLCNNLYANGEIGVLINRVKIKYGKNDATVTGPIAPNCSVGVGYTSIINTTHNAAVQLTYSSNILTLATKDTFVGYHIFNNSIVAKETIIAHWNYHPSIKIGVGIYHKKTLGTIYTGISFKKGLNRVLEINYNYVINGKAETTQLVSFNDDISLELNYYFKTRKHTLKPVPQSTFY